MLKLFYDQDLDYLEIFFEKTPNYGDEFDKYITVFKSEKNRRIVGYGIYRPRKQLLNLDFLNPKIKIAVLSFLERKALGLTEKDVAAKIGLSYRTYQRIEEGEISKIDDLIKIIQFISISDVSKIFKAS